MSSVNLQNTIRLTPNVTIKTCFTAIFCAVLLYLSNLAVAQTLVDTVTIPTRTPVQTGVVIETSEQSDAASEDSIDPTTIETTAGTVIMEYKRGNTLVREYRSRGQLLYVEIVQNDTNNPYVIDYSGDQSNPDKVTSGILVNQW